MTPPVPPDPSRNSKVACQPLLALLTPPSSPEGPPNPCPAIWESLPILLALLWRLLTPFVPPNLGPPGGPPEPSWPTGRDSQPYPALWKSLLTPPGLSAEPPSLSWPSGWNSQPLLAPQPLLALLEVLNLSRPSWWDSLPLVGLPGSLERPSDPSQPSGRASRSSQLPGGLLTPSVPPDPSRSSSRAS